MSGETDPSDDRLLTRQTTGEDCVRMVARQLSEPRTVNWIATEAEWSHGPTKRVLERLVDDGILRRTDTGTHTTYHPDHRQQALKEALRLRESGQSVEALTDRLSEMTAQIQAWKDEYAVSSPNELRATIADESVGSEETAARRAVARDWEHLKRRTQIVSFTIREWEFLTPGAAPVEADA